MFTQDLLYMLLCVMLECVYRWCFFKHLHLVVKNKNKYFWK